ncbi:YceI family protein [Daejeonella sp.]|jgi:polyisoprenoid-binding protein YceI|uniref:YceI family protein n=1 Tax=Daejeonella sp. TaxID=2805397 RepID=UPI0037840221
MKQIALAGILLFISFYSFAQKQLYTLKSSELAFFSKTPLVDIEANNIKANSIININNGEVVLRIPINQFQFSNKLMQQHFNENYLESEKYPYASFKGKINESLDFSKSGVYKISATGTLNIHGVDQVRTLNGQLSINGNSLNLQSQFDVMLVDHKIDIPKLVFKKIAEKIAVNAKLNYVPYTN